MTSGSHPKDEDTKRNGTTLMSASKETYFVELVTTVENLNDNYRPLFRATE